MKRFWSRILVFWYRLTGLSEVQAEWRARRALGRPREVGDQVRYQTAKAGDRRFKCVCGQLLVVGDRVCGQCNRKQYLPFWLRRTMRLLGLAVPSVVPGCLFVMVLIAMGFVIQLRFGQGGVMNPSTGLDYYQLGAALPELTNGPQPWRAFTYTLLHGGLMHIFFNCFVLIQIGPLIEKTFGTARFLFGWVITGALGVYIPSILGAGAWTIGASGAVFGLMGMALVFGHRLGTAEGRELRDVMVKWTIYTTIFGLMIGGVAHGAHFAGLGSGVVVGLLAPPPRDNPTAHRLTPFFGLLGVGGILYSLIAAFTWFDGGAHPPSELSAAKQLGIYRELGDAYGIERYLDDAGRNLLQRARRLRSREATMIEWDQFLREAVRDIESRPLVASELLRMTLAPHVRTGMKGLDRGGRKERAPTRGPLQP